MHDRHEFARSMRYLNTECFNNFIYILLSGFKDIEGNCQCVWIYSYFVFLSDLRSMYMKHIGILNNTVNSINIK